MTTTDTEIDTDTPSKSKPLVGSLVHGLNIIMSFDRANPEMTLSQVAERTGMDRAGARRYLLTLVDLGFMSQKGRLFRLTPRVLELGYAYLSTVPFTEKAQYYLNGIRDDSGFPVALGLRDGEHIVHVASANADEFRFPGLTIGRRFPIAYASAGRCILAFMSDDAREAVLEPLDLNPQTEHSLTTKDAIRAELKRIRAQGYALVEEEVQLGIRSLAVPVLDRRQEVVASFNTYTFIGITDREALLENCLPAMRSAAAELGKMLL